MSEVSSTNKTDHDEKTEILLKMALNTITLILTTNYFYKTLRAFKKWKIMSKVAHDKRKGSNYTQVCYHQVLIKKQYIPSNIIVSLTIEKSILTWIHSLGITSSVFGWGLPVLYCEFQSCLKGGILWLYVSGDKHT